ncbi:MAG: hypothetical protein HYW78_01840 [Parcubacteria group bacterium]|nr:hypothetical protein [Parcubacteria group bacterium]
MEPIITLRFILGNHEELEKLPAIAEELMKGDIICLEAIDTPSAKVDFENGLNSQSMAETGIDRYVIIFNNEFYSMLANKYILHSRKRIHLIDADESIEEMKLFEQMQRNLNDTCMVRSDIQSAFERYTILIDYVAFGVIEREYVVIKQLELIIATAKSIQQKEVLITVLEGEVHTRPYHYFKRRSDIRVERIFLDKKESIVRYLIPNELMRTIVFTPYRKPSEGDYKKGFLHYVFMYALEYYFERAVNGSQKTGTWYEEIASALIRNYFTDTDIAFCFRQAPKEQLIKEIDDVDREYWTGFNAIRWSVLLNYALGTHGISLPLDDDLKWAEKLEHLALQHQEK